MYSQTSIQLRRLGQRKNYRIRQFTALLRSFYLNYQVWYVMIHVLLLPEDHLLENMVDAF
jgi:hypothetical protein